VSKRSYKSVLQSALTTVKTRQAYQEKLRDKAVESGKYSNAATYEGTAIGLMIAAQILHDALEKG
jgi:hypothetical protein